MGFNAEMAIIKISWLYLSNLLTQVNEKLENDRLYVVYKGPDKQRRQENLKTLKKTSS